VSQRDENRPYQFGMERAAKKSIISGGIRTTLGDFLRKAKIAKILNNFDRCRSGMDGEFDMGEVGDGLIVNR
jgi:hypothetical protein